MCLLLIYLGGIIILFLYTTSLSNENKLIQLIKNYQFFFLILTRFLISLTLKQNLIEYDIINAISIFSMGGGLSTIIILYLLLVLFLSIKLLEGFKGAISKIF